MSCFEGGNDDYLSPSYSITYNHENDELILRDDKHCRCNDFTPRQVYFLYFIFFVTNFPDLAIFGINIDKSINLYIHLLTFAYISAKIVLFASSTQILMKVSKDYGKRKKLPYILIISSVLNLFGLCIALGIDKTHSHHDVLIGSCLGILSVSSSVLAARTIKMVISTNNEFLFFDTIDRVETKKDMTDRIFVTMSDIDQYSN